MNIPPYINCASQENYNIELNQTLHDNLGDSFVIPQITTVNLGLISSSYPDGSLWYLTDSTPPSPVMKINGIITPLASGGVATSVTGTTNQINVSPTTGAVVVSLANNAILPGTGGVTLPQGNTATRAGGAGTMRFNSQTGVFEGTTDGIVWDTFETTAIAVTSVSGTVGRITCSPTIGNVVVDIDSTYVGQTSITTLGTLISGAWHASTIGTTYGGTGLSNPTAHGVLISEGSSALNPIVLTAGQVLIGTTAADPAAATLTPGSNISITSASGSITIAATGVITSVAGTANQIDVNTVGGVSTVSIDANYVGQSSITTLGTITSGTWNGSIIDLVHGGTNANLTASNGGIVWSNATQMQILSGTITANQVLLSGNAATPAWSTATYPNTTTANQILYSSVNNTIQGLVTANSAVLVTDVGGVPSLSTTLPAVAAGACTCTESNHFKYGIYKYSIVRCI